MNKKKNQLFRIIAALQPTEKAYVKKFGYKQEKQDSSLFLLFDLIDKQLKQGSAVVEEKLIASFTKKFPNQNYIKVKSRLLELLLDALRDYDKKNNEVEKIYDYLAYASSLKKRNLFHDAWSVLKKAEKLAEELELIELLILIKTHKYYYEIYTQKYQLKHAENETIKHILEDVETLKNRIESDLAAYRILHFQKSIGIPRTEADFHLLQEIKEHPSFKEDYVIKLQNSKLNLAVAQNGIFFSVGDLNSVVKTSRKLIDEYDASKKLRKLNSAKYLSLFDSFLQAALLSLQISVYETYYPILKATPTYGEDDRQLKLGVDLFNRCMYTTVTGKLEHLPQLLTDFNEIKSKAYIPNYRKISLGYYLTLGHFLAEDYSQALEMAQWMKNNQQLGMRYDIEIGIWTMECLILLEKGEISLLHYRLRAFDEFLKSKDRKLEMERALLTLIRKILNAANEVVLQEVYTQFLDKFISVIESDPAAASFLMSFDILSWLKSRRKGIPFRTEYYENKQVAATS